MNRRISVIKSTIQNQNPSINDCVLSFIWKLFFHKIVFIRNFLINAFLMYIFDPNKSRINMRVIVNYC